MHIIIEQLYISRYNQHVSAGLRVSCDNRKSWVVKGEITLKQDEVSSFEHYHKEISVAEYSRRLAKQYDVTLTMVMP